MSSYLSYDHLRELKQRGIRYWTDNKYSSISKWYYIFASDIPMFFDLLIGTDFVGRYNFKHYQFNDVIVELLDREYIDLSQCDYYMHSLPHNMTVNEIVEVLKKSKSYQDYIDYINTYSGANDELGDSLMTLIGKGQKYMPPGECIIDYVNPHVLEVFNSDHIYAGY